MDDLPAPNYPAPWSHTVRHPRLEGDDLATFCVEDRLVMYDEDGNYLEAETWIRVGTLETQKESHTR